MTSLPATLPEGPAFLRELSPEATLSMSVLPKTVTGAEAVTLVIRTLVSLYASSQIDFRGSIENRSFTNYRPTLLSGETLEATVTLLRGDDQKIRHVSINYSPLPAVLVLAGQLERALGAK